MAPTTSNVQHATRNGQREQMLSHAPRSGSYSQGVESEDQPTEIDLMRTRVMLQRMQGEQERLHAQLEAAGVTSFADRSDWLIAHRTPDEQLAWVRRWRRLGLRCPEPRLSSEVHFKRGSLARVKQPRKRRPPVIAPARQLEIALAALAVRSAA